MPIPGLSETGTFSYNGYTFDNATRADVSTRYIRNGLGLAITTHEITINVTWEINNDSGTDEEIKKIRRKLGQQAGPLVFTGRGFGNDIRVNTGGGVTDLAGGPAPTQLRWTPLGDNKTVQLQWSVVTRIPVAASLGVQVIKLGVIGVDYTVRYSTDKFGDTTRTFNGTIEISARRIGRDSADRFREFFRPRGLVGFQRTEDWSLSADRLRAEFTIIDRERPGFNAYPTLIVEASGSHRTSWSLKSGNSINTITATLAPHAFSSPERAYDEFIKIIELRYEVSRIREGSPIPISLDVEENLFGYPQSFTFRYQITGGIKDFVSKSGLWVPLDYSWRRWRVGLVAADRGNAKLGDQAEVAFDGAAVPIKPNNNQDINKKNQRIDARRQIFLDAKFRRAHKTPDEKTSFLEFENEIEVHHQSGAKLQTILANPETETDQGKWDIDTAIPQSSVPSYDRIQSSGSAVEDVIQESGLGGVFGLRMTGKARRAGHPMPRPNIKKVVTRAGDRPAFLRDSRMMQTVRRDAMGIPIYDSWWILDFIVNGPFSSQPLSPNPKEIPGRTFAKAFERIP